MLLFEASSLHYLPVEMWLFTKQTVYLIWWYKCVCTIVYRQQPCRVGPITVHLADSWRADGPSVCPERGARTAGHEQSVTGGHRCLSFTLQRQTQLQQHVASNLATRQQTWQPITRRQGLPLTASNSGTSRGKHTHTILDYWVVLNLIFMEFKGLGQK